MSDARVEVYEDREGEYRWRLIAGNGEQVAQGEGYTRRRDAWRGWNMIEIVLTTSKPILHLDVLTNDEDEDEDEDWEEEE